MSLNIYDFFYNSEKPLFYYRDVCPIFPEPPYFKYSAKFIMFGDGQAGASNRSVSSNDLSFFYETLSSYSFVEYNGVLFAYISRVEDSRQFSSLAYEESLKNQGVFRVGYNSVSNFSDLGSALNYIIQLYFNAPDTISYYDNWVFSSLPDAYLETDENGDTYSITSTKIVQIVGFVPFPICCYPDFLPIVQILGGTPSSDQLINLKSICQLLGVDTSENGLSGCELMKEYLRRLNQNLGGTPFTEPNDNLKSICYLLGVDTSENGLSGCELSKDYVKRDGIMLGAEYA